MENEFENEETCSHDKQRRKRHNTHDNDGLQKAVFTQVQSGYDVDMRLQIM